MMAPYFLERARRERCGRLLNWWRLPMIGSLGGDGGNLTFLGEIGRKK